MTLEWKPAFTKSYIENVSYQMVEIIRRPNTSWYSQIDFIPNSGPHLADKILENNGSFCLQTMSDAMI